MFRSARLSALAALFAVSGLVLAGCDEASEADQQPFSGTTKIDVGGKSVNVSCSGTQTGGRPVVVLLAGAGDPLEKLAELQKTLSEKDRVCSYDRLGEGASDQPDGPQSFEDSGKILTAVLDKVAGDTPVVLSGHSLGGLVAARYTPGHQDKVKGLVLMDATTPTAVTDTLDLVPESATGMAAELRAQMVAISQGDFPEKLKVVDGAVPSAGDIPVEVIQAGKQEVAAVPQYGPALERVWFEGQRKWLGLSNRSTLVTATESGHYIYVDQPALAVQAIQRVTAQVAG